MHLPTSQGETLSQLLFPGLQAALAADTSMRPPGGACWDCRIIISKSAKKLKIIIIIVQQIKKGFVLQI